MSIIRATDTVFAMINNSNASSTPSSGQFINYIEDYGAIYLPYLILNFIGIVTGIIGNILILFVIYMDDKLNKNPAYMLMFNLSLSDLGISIFVNIFTNIGILYGEGYFSVRMAFCIFLGSFCLVACGTSLVNMGFLAVNRYINICHHNQYQKFFTRRNTIICCAVAWCAGILVDLPNFVGWGGHYFDRKSANCMWNRLANRSYSIFFPTTSIFLPCVMILFCYAKIFLYTYETRKNSLVNQKELMQSFKVARSLFASFALFTICWVPYGLIVALDFSDQVQMSVHVLVTFMAHINSAMNPVFYILLNPTFKKSFASLFNKNTKVSRLDVTNTNNTPTAGK